MTDFIPPQPAANSKPVSMSYYQMSFGTVEVSRWTDGRSTARIRLDPSLRNAPVRFENESDDSFSRRQSKFDDFTKYGQIRIHSSDVFGLLDVFGCIRPDLSISVSCGGGRS